MMIELCAYGLFAGLLRGVKLPTIGKVIGAQAAGRLVRAAAVLLAVYAFGSSSVRVASIWMSLAAGLPGLVLQWGLLPLVVYRVENRSRHEN